MALATQCPHCRTTFRVALDQLKLRAGLVRCGACKQIFNGLEQLLPSGDAPKPPAASAGPAGSPQSNPDGAPAQAVPVKTAAVSTAAPNESRHGAGPTLPKAPIEPDSVPAPSTEPSPDENSDDPLLRMTLMDFSEFERASEGKTGAAGGESAGDGAEEDAATEDLNQAIQDLQNTLRSDPKRAASLTKLVQPVAAPEVPEPAFVQQARRQARIGHSLRMAMRTATIALLVVLIGQGAYAFRDQLAAWLPQTAPALSKGCAMFGCSVGLPAQIDSVSIESSELQALASSQNTFALVTLLRNRSMTVQTWPHIELTLNDANEKAIVRRVIGPRDYLPSAQEITKGLAANSEQPVKVFFELSQLKAAGYRVYLFYP
jgi:predicted Zn finger-like uncharacterized protein